MLYHLYLFFVACLVVCPFYLLIRRPWRFKGRISRIRELILGLFIVFMTGLLFMTFWALYPPFTELIDNMVYRVRTGYNIGMRPFYNLHQMYLYDDREHFIMNVLGNTLMFLPWGFCRPLLWKKQNRFYPIVFGALYLTMFIETVQLFSYNRTVDIDDIILNAGASVFGSILYLISAAIWPKLKKLQK